MSNYELIRKYPKQISLVKKYQCSTCSRCKTTCANMSEYSHDHAFGKCRLPDEVDSVEFAFCCLNRKAKYTLGKISAVDKKQEPMFFKCIKSLPVMFNIASELDTPQELPIVCFTSIETIQKELMFSYLNQPVLKYYDQDNDVTFIKISITRFSQFAIYIIDGNCVASIPYAHWLSSNDIIAHDRNMEYTT